MPRARLNQSRAAAAAGSRRAAVILTLALLGVVAGTEPVDDHGRLVSDHPRIMTFGQGRDISRTRDDFSSVVHTNRKFS